MATGFNKQSDEPPGAWLVELPSKDHIGQSSNLPLKFSTIFVLLLNPWVGVDPSNQMYSNFDFDMTPEIYFVMQFLIDTSKIDCLPEAPMLNIKMHCDTQMLPAQPYNLTINKM